jgi:hypothetical protein
MVVLGTASGVPAADKCPAELAQAKAALKTARAPQDIQSPRSQAGAKAQDIQSPRTQEIQAPRGQQDIQAPRGQQEIQAPRTQEIEAPRSQQEIPVPRGQEIQAPRVAKAAALVKEADAACKKGDMALSAKKAREALGLLR